MGIACEAYFCQGSLDDLMTNCTQWGDQAELRQRTGILLLLIWAFVLHREEQSVECLTNKGQGGLIQITCLSSGYNPFKGFGEENEEGY